MRSRNQQQFPLLEKSEVVASVLAAYLGSVQDVSLKEMVFQLEKRVTLLEAELKHG